MILTKRNSVILEVTNDKYELPIAIYEDMKELARRKKRTVDSLKGSIAKDSITRANTKLIKVYIGDKNIENSLDL